MTVVVAFNWLDEIVMLADSRVSWNGTRPPEDVLIKLHVFNDSKKAIVLGFSGDLEVIKMVMLQLNDKFKNYNHRFVISILKDKVRGWIEEATLGKLRSGVKSSIKFILCGMEKSRHPPVMQDGLVIGYMSLPQIHLYEYIIDKSSGKVTVDSKSVYSIIGSGKELETEIIKTLEKGIKFGFNVPQLRWARSIIVSDALSLLFKDTPQEKTVGGPFQYVRVTPDRLQQGYVWPSGGEFKNLEVRKESTKTILYSPELNRSIFSTLFGRFLF